MSPAHAVKLEFRVRVTCELGQCIDLCHFVEDKKISVGQPVVLKMLLN